MPPTLTISRVFHCSSTIYSAEHSTVTTTLSRFCNCSLHNAQQTSFIPQLMIAPPLTGASMHYHYTAGTFAAFGCAKVYSSLRCVAANALVYGAKRWFLISPEQAMYATACCTPAFPPSLSLPNPCTWMRSFQPRYHARGCVRSNHATMHVDASFPTSLPGTAASTLSHGLPRTCPSFASRCHPRVARAYFATTD